MKILSASEMWDMKLNEKLDMVKGGEVTILRVAGGWIYNQHFFDGERVSTNSTFVPLNNEFLGK